MASKCAPFLVVSVHLRSAEVTARGKACILGTGKESATLSWLD